MFQFSFFLIPFRSQCFFFVLLSAPSFLIQYSRSLFNPQKKRPTLSLRRSFCAGVFGDVCMRCVFLLCQDAYDFLCPIRKGGREWGSNFFSGVDDLTWYTIFFSYYIFSYSFSLLWTMYRAATDVNSGKKEFCYRVCQDSLFRTVDMCLSFFRFCCCASSTTTQKKEASERHRHTTERRYKNIIFLLDDEKIN